MLQFNIIYLELYDVEMLIIIHFKNPNVGILSTKRNKMPLRATFLIIRSGQ